MVPNFTLYSQKHVILKKNTKSKNHTKKIETKGLKKITQFRRLVLSNGGVNLITYRLRLTRNIKKLTLSIFFAICLWREKRC